jgi:hypothetical protein
MSKNFSTDKFKNTPNAGLSHSQNTLNLTLAGVSLNHEIIHTKSHMCEEILLSQLMFLVEVHF